MIMFQTMYLLNPCRVDEHIGQVINFMNVIILLDGGLFFMHAFLGQNFKTEHWHLKSPASRFFKTSKLRVTDLCEGNSPVTGEFPAQRANNAENVSIWWRHHAVFAKADTKLSSFSLWVLASVAYKGVEICQRCLWPLSWAQWRLKSPASRLFNQLFVQVQIGENTKTPR